MNNPFILYIPKSRQIVKKNKRSRNFGFFYKFLFCILCNFHKPFSQQGLKKQEAVTAPLFFNGKTVLNFVFNTVIVTPFNDLIQYIFFFKFVKPFGDVAVGVKALPKGVDTFLA